MSARCKSCGAEVEWYQTVKGKAIQLDIGSFENGNMTVWGGIVRSRTDDDAVHGRPARRAHFSSCPQADMWRRRS